MGMIDFYSHEQVSGALTVALELKEEFTEETHKLDNYIFVLKYYLATGESLDPNVIELPEEQPND
jgi:hypothetical protein